jgi:hypothetical protein
MTSSVFQPRFAEAMMLASAEAGVLIGWPIVTTLL